MSKFDTSKNIERNDLRLEIESDELRRPKRIMLPFNSVTH